METLNQDTSVKSLLVLTDFSQSAKNAAEYALHLARRIQADVILFNAYLIPDIGFDSWPTGDESNRSKQSLSSLQEESSRLQNLTPDLTGTFTPKCAVLSVEGGMAENVTAIIEDRKDVLMVIMGGGKCNGREDMLFGEEITQILVNVKCPTLIVPNLAYLDF